MPPETPEFGHLRRALHEAQNRGKSDTFWNRETVSKLYLIGDSGAARKMSNVANSRNLMICNQLQFSTAHPHPSKQWKLAC
jgi:hypothetical protein